jgi:hypothetical protein
MGSKMMQAAKLDLEQLTTDKAIQASIETFELINYCGGDRTWFEFVAIASAHVREYLKSSDPQTSKIVYNPRRSCDRPWKIIASNGMEIWSFPNAINVYCALFALHLYKLDNIDYPIATKVLTKLNEIIDIFGDVSFTPTDELLELARQWDLDNIPF